MLPTDRVWLPRTPSLMSRVFVFFNDTATTEIYTLSLHDALPISSAPTPTGSPITPWSAPRTIRDRKSTRLNSSHLVISYAVFCLKKKWSMSSLAALLRQQLFIFSDLGASLHD